MVKNLNRILFDFSTINTWEEWDDFTLKHFKMKDWESPDYSKDDIFNDFEIELEGNIWINYIPVYKVNSHLYDLYELLSREVYLKINKTTSDIPDEWVEKVFKACHFCKIYTKNFKVEFCPICSNKLRIF